MLDYLLRNGRIIDGTGSPSYAADVGISNDRIDFVGKADDSVSARQTLDISGHVVAPGFVDTHNHSDAWLLTEQNLEPKTRQGFTTEVLMSDGISYAPVSSETIGHWIQYLRSLNGMRHEHYLGWHSLNDYGSLVDRSTAQNFVLQIPYANVRTLVAGFSARPLDDFQRQQMRYEVEKGMAEGATGLSTGMDYISQCFAPTSELVDACRAMQPYDGLYVTHVRYKDGLIPAISEAIEIGRQSGVRVHISHLKPLSDGEYEPLCELLEAGSKDVSISFDIYPYQSSSTMLNFLLPYEVWENGVFDATGHILKPRIRGQLAQVLIGRGSDKNETIRIGWVPGRDNAAHIGKSLVEYADCKKMPVADAACNLLMEENLCVLMVLDDPRDHLHQQLIPHSMSMLGTDGIYFPDGKVHPRMFGSVGRWIGPYVRDLKLFSLEEAVRKMTSIPCERFGIRDRGLIETGKFADLVVFDPAIVDGPASIEEPNQFCPGIRDVFVNGEPVVTDNAACSWPQLAPGRYLRK